MSVPGAPQICTLDLVLQTAEVGVPPSLKAELPIRKMFADFGIGTSSALHQLCMVQG